MQSSDTAPLNEVVKYAPILGPDFIIDQYLWYRDHAAKAREYYITVTWVQSQTSREQSFYSYGTRERCGTECASAMHKLNVSIAW